MAMLRLRPLFGFFCFGVGDDDDDDDDDSLLQKKISGARGKKKKNKTKNQCSVVAFQTTA